MRSPAAIADQEPSDLSLEPADLLSTPEAGPAAVRGGAMRMGSFAAGSLVAIGSAALLFRHLGVVQTGHYTTALNLSAIVTGFTDLGLTAIGIRELAVLSGAERARMASNLLGIRLVLTVIGVAAITGFALLAYGGFLALGVLIAGLGVLVANTQTTLAVPLMSSLRLGWVSTLDLVRQLVTSGLIVILVVLGAHLLPFLATPAIAATAVLIPTALLVRGNIPLQPSFRLGEWRALLGPIVTYSAAVAASTLYFRVAIVLVSLIAGAHELGYYSVPFRAVEVLFTIPALLISSAFPIFARAARDDQARLGYAVSRVFEVSLVLGAGVALLLGIGARLVVLILGGHVFLPATQILAVQGLAVGATFVSAVWGYALLSLRLHRAILLFNLCALTLLVPLVGILAAVDGAEGAAIGTAAAEIGAAIGGGVLLVRGRPHLRPRLSVVPKVALAAAAGSTLGLATGLPVIVRVLLAAGVYGAVLLALKALPAEADVVLPRLLRHRG